MSGLLLCWVVQSGPPVVIRIEPLVHVKYYVN